MNVADIPESSAFARKIVTMDDLLVRASGSKRATWTDLLKGPGIYVVVWASNNPIDFAANSGRAKHATSIDPAHLREKWEEICRCKSTDIIYIGKGVNIKPRIRQLARFGVGRARNHRGGEWMWQVSGIASTSVFMYSCPIGKEIAFENWLLETFWDAHRSYPLANRNGPEGSERWHP